ncbi:MAG: hypothetical protein U0269_04095 [Polyangiales bacterium]
MLSPSSVKVARRALFAAGGAGASLAALGALPQALTAPALGAPDAALRAQLRALAAAGAVVLVDDVEAGANAKVTVLCKVPAGINEVRAVIAAPDRYGDFMAVLRDCAIDSRSGSMVGFRFRAVASIFDIETHASMRVINARRIDVAIVRSDLGPGAARWELFEEPDGSTLISCSCWGDPSRGHWIFRQIAARSNAAVSMMTTAVALLLSLSLARRLRRSIASPLSAGAPPLAPLPVEAQRLVSPRGVLGAITLRPDGSLVQASSCVAAPGSVTDVDRWLSDPSGYSQVWRSFRNVRTQPRAADGVRFAADLEAGIGRSSGTRLLATQRDANAFSARWIGIDGDERGHELRWDARALNVDQVALCASVRDEVARVGFPLRSTLDREPALRAGFGFGLSVVWARSLANRLRRDWIAARDGGSGDAATTEGGAVPR